MSIKSGKIRSKDSLTKKGIKLASEDFCIINKN
nr:MAG TPA: hypothetical protein [Caudoviricetes sp.]